MPSRDVCQRARRGERAQQEENTVISPIPTACAGRQRRLRAWPPADPSSPHVQAYPPSPTSLPDRRAAALERAAGAEQAQYRSRRQVLSEQRWVGGGEKTAVVQGAVSSSQVRPGVEPRPCGTAVSTRGRGQVRTEIFQGARLPETPAPPTSPGGEVTPTVVEGRRQVGAARWRSCRAGVATTPPIGDVHM